MSRLALPAIAALAACSIPDTTFRPTPDGGELTSVLAIKASVSSFDVDEGGRTDFAVSLTQAPSAELVVKVAPGDAASLAAIGISLPELRFQPTNFDQPQTITVTGLSDVDTADVQASISLTASGVDTVTLNATVRDHDKVEIATDIAPAGLTIDETRSADVHVHLTHRPAADVRVKVVLGTGPVTVTPAEHTFTAANYDVDQTFTFSAPDDANVVDEDQSLTFQGTGLADRLYTIHDHDKDKLNISVTPSAPFTVDEGGGAQLSVALTRQPPSNTTVHLELQSGNVSINHTDLMFTPQNYDTAQAVIVSAPQDLNTVNEQDQITLSIPALPSVATVSVGVRTVDDDTQAILEDAPDPLSLTENQTATFGVTLKFQPTSNITLTVSAVDPGVATASPGILTFTPQNYADAAMHQVTVRGTDDNNLATNTTSITLHEPTLVDKLARVSVVDDDRQAIVLGTSTLTIPEGMSRSFDVSLKFDPGTTVTVNLTNTNQTALPIDKSSITFTTANYSTPVHVTVSPPLDSNAAGETATITVSGAGAPNPATLTATVMDSTVITQYGFPMPFPNTASVILGQVIAYRITVDATNTLDSFGVYIPVGTGDFRMALYADGLNAPGALVAAMPVRKAIVSGTNTGDIPDVSLPLGTYWIVLRVAQTTAVGFSAVGTGPVCVRNTDIPNIDDLWPTSFGGATCGSDHFMNFSITTYHQ
jgi:hypothetical protein